MALEMLAQDPVTHTYHHDLESFFYVFLWICTFYSKPGVEIGAKDAKEKPMYYWNDRGKESSSKEVHMKSYQRFERKILDNFAEYFEDFKGLAKELYEAVFPACGSQSTVTHKSFISILEVGIKKLELKPEEQVSSPPSPESEIEVPYHVGFAKRMIEISLPTEGWQSAPPVPKRPRLH